METRSPEPPVGPTPPNALCPPPATPAARGPGPPSPPIGCSACPTSLATCRRRGPAPRAGADSSPPAPSRLAACPLGAAQKSPSVPADGGPACLPSAPLSPHSATRGQSRRRPWADPSAPRGGDWLCRHTCGGRVRSSTRRRQGSRAARARPAWSGPAGGGGAAGAAWRGAAGTAAGAAQGAPPGEGETSCRRARPGISHIRSLFVAARGSAPPARRRTGLQAHRRQKREKIAKLNGRVSARSTTGF